MKKHKHEEVVRVLVVDDSVFMRKLLTEAIESDPQCTVIGTASDGVKALKAVEELRPDVVTLDIELPEIDGLAALVYIMEKFPTPAVMVTGFSSYMGDKTISALQHGAAGFVRKPGGAGTGSVAHSVESMRIDLLTQIKMAAGVPVKKLRPVVGERPVAPPKKTIPKTTNRIVAIAASSGGPRALGVLIRDLPVDLKAGVIVVQHMPPEFIPPLTNRLNMESALEVKVARNEELIRQGEVLLVPSHCHFTLESKKNSGELIRLAPADNVDEHQFGLADETMTSLAAVYEKNTTGVVLTGMGSDGTQGLRAIREHGGRTIAEDESTCIVNGMPGSAIRAGVVDKVIPLHKMAAEIVKAVNDR